MTMPRPFRPIASALLALMLAACGTGTPEGPGLAAPAARPFALKLIAFNDLHGHLEPPQLAVAAPSSTGGTVAVPAGGVAYMASALASLKAQNPHHAVVSAGDMIGASPLVSALFLDEPTIEAVNAMGIDFNAVGNHEFDKGQAELLRMQHGGCARNTALVPCQGNQDFPGANFGFLAANTVKGDGTTLFPATGRKTFRQGDAQVTVGFIGLTLKATPTAVTPSGVAGLTFKDEADTANALIPGLRAQGADVIVVVMHEGGTTTVGYNDKRCAGLSGNVRTILDRLDARVDVVISGHTHSAYVCDYGRINPAKPFLLTSAGQYGTLLTDIDLVVDTTTRKVTAKSANNLIVQGEAFTRGATTVALSDQYPRFQKNAEIDALVARYRTVAAPLVQRVVGRLTAPASRALTPSRESVLGNLIADSQLAATARAAKGGAQIAFMNPGGVRAELVPSANGELRYGQLFSVQPFGNSLVVKTMTGTQIRALLEQQFASGTNTVAAPRVLMPSHGFRYRYDLSQPAGRRIEGMALDGVPLADGKAYRVAMNSFLASGGDNFTVFNQGTEVLGGDLDIDAFEAYLQAHPSLVPPPTDRITAVAPPR